MPFGLYPSAPDEDRPLTQILELRLPEGETDWLAAFAHETVETVQVWSIDDVLKNLAMEAAIHHVLAAEYADGSRQPKTTTDEMRQWIAGTRSLADRLPIGRLRSGVMKIAADGLEEMLDGPARFFKSWPTSLETKAHCDWIVSRNLWAADRLLRAVNELEPDFAQLRQMESGESVEFLKVPTTKFWEAMFNWFPTERVPSGRERLPFCDYENAQKRVTNLEKTIKPETRDDLMIVLLREVLHNGRYRPGPPQTAQKPH
jgi:hypothetical protein